MCQTLLTRPFSPWIAIPAPPYLSASCMKRPPLRIPRFHTGFSFSDQLAVSPKGHHVMWSLHPSFFPFWFIFVSFPVCVSIFHRLWILNLTSLAAHILILSFPGRSPHTICGGFDLARFIFWISLPCIVLWIFFARHIGLEGPTRTERLPFPSCSHGTFRNTLAVFVPFFLSRTPSTCDRSAK